jgi:hypothetical protein
MESRREREQYTLRVIYKNGGAAEVAAHSGYFRQHEVVRTSPLNRERNIPHKSKLLDAV